MKRKDIFSLIGIGLLVALVYIPTFIWMVNRWTVADTYYSHGFLVPFISAFIVWHKRKEFAELKIKTSRRGWVFFIGGMILHAVSALWQVYFSSGFSLIFVIIGLIMVLLGREFLKQLLFPVLFLGFMIPLPMVAIANISFRLKIFAAQVSVFIVKMIGVQAVREGSVIKTAHSYLMVEDPCSGIRSLIALIALGTLMSYFAKMNRIKKLVMFATSIPIAILANVVRIVTLTVVSEVYGAKAATGTFHDLMGLLVFVFAFLGLALVSKILE